MYQYPPPAQIDASYDQNDGRVLFDMREIATMLWRGKWPIALCAVIGLGVGVWQSYFSQIPLYGSDAQIVVETRDEQVIDLEKVLSNLSTSEEALHTESLILNGRRLMGLVVDKLALTDDPEFNPDLIETQPGLLAGLKTQIQDSVTVRLGLSRETKQIQTADETEAVRSAIVSQLQKQVTVRNIPNTYAFSIWVVTQDPYKSQRIADAIAKTYIQDQLAAKFDATTQASAWLSNQAAKLEAELEVSERELTELSNDMNFIAPEEINTMEYRIVQLRRSMQDKQFRLDTDLATLARLENAVDMSTRQRIAKDLGLTQSVTQNAISDHDWTGLISTVRQNIEDADIQISFLEHSIADLETQLIEQGLALSQLEEIEQETAAKRLFYDSLRGRLRETSIQTGLQRADSRMTSNATLLTNPISPNKSRLMGLGLFFGALIGATYILGKNLISPKVSSASRLSALTNLPVLASLPVFSLSTRMQRVQTPRTATSDSEAVRGLRNALQIQKTQHGRPPQVILFTSTSSGEGKTTIATAIAASFGQAGQKVLLIDCDTRRGTASLRLTRRPQHALTDVLHGKCDLQTAITPTDLPGLDILPAFTMQHKTDGIEALNRRELDDVLDRARQSWDIIILDTPPAMVISDTLLLAEKADFRLLLATCDTTSEADVVLCIDRLHHLGQTPDAIVINKSRNTREIFGLGRRAKGYYKNLIAA